MRVSTLPLVVLSLASVALTNAGCGTDGGSGDGPATIPATGPWNTGEAIPPADQKPGDPEAGLLALSTESYVSCGIPLSVFAFAGALNPNTDDAPLPGREGDAARLPYPFNLVTTEDGAELATQNCFTCHAERFNGKLVLGLGNVTSNFTNDQSGIGDFMIPGGFLSPADTAALTKFQQRAVAVAPYIVMKTIGTNPADLIAMVLASRRNKDTLAWLDEPSWDLTGLPPIPADVPPWWRMAKKNSMFSTGLGRGDTRRHMLASSTLCTDNLTEAAAIDAYANDINAYIRSIQPPDYPFAIDAELASKGEGVFITTCAGCHGTYGAEATYPNLSIPLSEIGTDGVIASGYGEFQDDFIDWFNDSFYGEVGYLERYKGYVAPPLDGIWATAPFLHNGSVPTIELVLNSTARPKFWKREDLDSKNFDEDALGWPFAELAAGQAEAAPGDRPNIYDTTNMGHGNGGHIYGDDLSDADRKAVLEYLKTL